MYIAICADSAGVRVDVAFVGEIVSHGIVWVASIVRLNNSPIASCVAVDILIGECAGIKNSNAHYKKDCE